jgi:hypothetical protein
MDKLAATPIGMLSMNSNIMHPKIEAGELGTVVHKTQI